MRPVILANGIKLHVQPQNLVLAANLAGVSRINNQVSGDLQLLLMASVVNVDGPLV